MRIPDSGCIRRISEIMVCSIAMFLYEIQYAIYDVLHTFYHVPYFVIMSRPTLASMLPQGSSEAKRGQT